MATTAAAVEGGADGSAVQCSVDGEAVEMRAAVESFRDALRAARHVVFLCGAGISAESGIPTFRGAGGLWRTYDAMQLASPEAFRDNPGLVWEFYEYRRRVVAEARPNAGHVSLASLERQMSSEEGDDEGRSMHILTQNIDRLQHAAGSSKDSVTELHGSLWLVKRVGEQSTLEQEGVVWENRQLPICPALASRCAPEPDADASLIPIADLPHHESDLLRPAVVWFGEGLDDRVLERTMKELARCDLFVVVGTSAVVYPAAGFVEQVAANGVPVCQVNLETTSHSSLCKWVFQGPSGEVLPELFGDDIRDEVTQIMAARDAEDTSAPATSR